MAKHFAQTRQKRFCLTNERNSTILILTGAPSPSGKAGDFDSPIVGSTPAGATEDRLLKETFGRRSLCFAAASGAAAHFAGGGAVLRKNRALREGCARWLCGVSF